MTYELGPDTAGANPQEQVRKEESNSFLGHHPKMIYPDQTQTGRLPGSPSRGSSRLAALAVTVAVSVLMLLIGPEPSFALPGGTRWDWPSGTPVEVTERFNPPAQPWLPGHRGVDLAAPIGSTIYAPAAGTVIFAGQVVDRQVVSLMHEGGLRSTYEPVIPLVSSGETVDRGAAIATVAEGHSPGPLHWGARFGPDEYVNPLRMIVGPSVLKRWD